jgi:hypothetical protein
MHETGGKDSLGVINDLMHKFNPSLKPIKAKNYALPLFQG